MDRYCKRHEEKQTDVAIAVNVLSDALLDKFDKAFLITADSDQIPLVRKLKELCPKKTIILAAPPDRETDARELGSIVHERQPLTWGRLATCKLPRSVKNAAGAVVATMPAVYAAAKRQ